MTETHDVGDIRRLAATFRDHLGALVDPDTVQFTMAIPDGTATTYTYGAGAEIRRESVGVFYSEYRFTAPGRHVYRWSTDGNVVAAEEYEVYIRRSEVPV